MKENKFKQAEIGLIPEDYGDRLGDIGRLRIMDIRNCSRRGCRG